MPVKLFYYRIKSASGTNPPAIEFNEDYAIQELYKFIFEDLVQKDNDKEYEEIPEYLTETFIKNNKPKDFKDLIKNSIKKIKDTQLENLKIDNLNPKGKEIVETLQSMFPNIALKELRGSIRQRILEEPEDLEQSVSYSNKGFNQQEFAAYKNKLEDYVKIKSGETVGKDSPLKQRTGLDKNTYSISLDETELNFEGLDIEGDEIDFDTSEAFDSIREREVDTKLLKLFTLGFNNIKLNKIVKVQDRATKSITTSPETLNYLENKASYSGKEITQFTKNQLRQSEKVAESLSKLTLAEKDLAVAVSIRTLGSAIASYTDIYANIIQNMRSKNISIDKQVGEATGKLFSGDKKEFNQFVSQLKNTGFDAMKLIEAKKSDKKSTLELKQEFLDKISEKVDSLVESYDFLGDTGRKENRLKNISKNLTSISNELSKVFNKSEKEKDEVNSAVIALGREIARDLDKIVLSSDLTALDLAVPEKYKRNVRVKLKGLNVRMDIVRPINDKFSIGDILSNPILRLQEALDESIDESIQTLQADEKMDKNKKAKQIKELEEIKEKGPEWRSIFAKAGITDKEGHFTEQFIDDVEKSLMIDIDDMVYDLEEMLNKSYAFKEFAKSEKRIKAIIAGLQFDASKKSFSYKDFKKIVDEMYSKYKETYDSLRKTHRKIEKEFKSGLDFGKGNVKQIKGFEEYKEITGDKNAKKYFDAAKANDKKKIISLLSGSKSPFKNSLKVLKNLSKYMIKVKLGKDREGNPKYTFTVYKQLSLVEAETRLIPRGTGKGEGFRPIRQPKIGVSKFKRVRKGEFATFMDSIRAGIKELEDELQEMI
tara:strand:+ start:1069 stop:3543 length:2475 start_codon:yes stop_codon:yes gene_type:complete